VARGEIAHEAQFALAANLAQRFIGSSGGDRLPNAEDPNPLFLVQPNSSPAWTKDDAVFRAFQFQGIARAELHFIANRLGQDDAAGFVQRQGGCHGSIVQWHLPSEDGIYSDVGILWAGFSVCLSARQPDVGCECNGLIATVIFAVALSLIGNPV
jgi:hypothetical protein